MTDEEIARYFCDAAADGLRIAQVTTRRGYAGRAVIARTRRQHKLAVIGRAYGCRGGVVLGWEKLHWWRGWLIYPLRLPTNDAVAEALRQAGDVGISFMRLAADSRPQAAQLRGESPREL